jgi:type IV secretory pathway protease TraF
MRRLLLVVGLVALLAAAAIAANIALLGYATSSSDPVGNLSPRTSLPHPHAAVHPRPPPRASRADREDD